MTVQSAGATVVTCGITVPKFALEPISSEVFIVLSLNRLRLMDARHCWAIMILVTIDVFACGHIPYAGSDFVISADAKRSICPAQKRIFFPFVRLSNADRVSFRVE